MDNKILENEDNIKEETLDSILFGTLYRRKISIKDWLYTKTGFLVFCIFVYLLATSQLDGIAIALLLITVLFLYNREESLAYEKEQTVWLIKAKKIFFNALDEHYYKKQLEKSKSKESKEILEQCKRERK